ncbi:hypothetical protein TH63_02180 [Rufibacter radiotolerans]|uniref:Uncharacterized protein n=1 Tax=Rufibacter radiotolerans TaxID=1379910 RepID=A0A0H4W2N3_9BACT|nr:hypothetical protein TH63_02180 [Rufibacter radiotolerans]
METLAETLVGAARTTRSSNFLAPKLFRICNPEVPKGGFAIPSPRIAKRVQMQDRQADYKSAFLEFGITNPE